MMKPVQQNSLAAIATVVYVKAVIGTCDWSVSKGILSSAVSRKIVHVSAGSWILFWPLFDKSHWTWHLNILVPAVYSVQLFVKGAIVRDKNDPEVRSMTRHGNPTELLYGPLFFTLVMNYVGTYCFRTQLGVSIMACLGFGDGIAPLVGKAIPLGQYPTFPFGSKDKKTLSGSLAFFMSSMLGVFVFSHLIEDDRDASNFLQVAALATVTEGISGSYDNLAVPFVIFFGSKYFKLTSG